MKMNMDWALFGYKDKEPYGEFLGERATKEELMQLETLAREHGFTRFNYSHFEGLPPDFTKTINV
jgi:hypothetical protein